MNNKFDELAMALAPPATEFTNTNSIPLARIHSAGEPTYDPGATNFRRLYRAVWP